MTERLSGRAHVSRAKSASSVMRRFDADSLPGWDQMYSIGGTNRVRLVTLKAQLDQRHTVQQPT